DVSIAPPIAHEDAEPICVFNAAFEADETGLFLRKRRHTLTHGVVIGAGGSFASAGEDGGVIRRLWCGSYGHSSLLRRSAPMVTRPAHNPCNASRVAGPNANCAAVRAVRCARLLPVSDDRRAAQASDRS